MLRGYAQAHLRLLTGDRPQVPYAMTGNGLPLTTTRLRARHVRAQLDRWAEEVKFHH